MNKVQYLIIDLTKFSYFIFQNNHLWHKKYVPQTNLKLWFHYINFPHFVCYSFLFLCVIECCVTFIYYTKYHISTSKY